MAVEVREGEGGGIAPGRLSAGSCLDLVIADAGWHTTSHLFSAVPPGVVETLLLECLDFRNARQQWGRMRSGPLVRERPGLWRRRLSLPPGWMKTLPAIGMRPIASAIRSWRRRLGRETPLVLVITYPHYRFLASMLRPERLIYFNVDDYTLYWPGQAETVRRIERLVVQEADLTVCVANARAEELRAGVPGRASRILHVPHGAPGDWIGAVTAGGRRPPTDLDALPRPWIGYLGTMEDRVDWPLLGRVATGFPEASLVLVGPASAQGDAPWQQSRREVLSLPNVHAIGPRPQADLPLYNGAFDVGLIPYDVAHPFNLASCPTKIMDYLACGCPVVATDLPECRLHARRMSVATTHDEFLDAVSRLLADGPSNEMTQSARDWVAENSCEIVVSRLIERIRALG